VHSTPLPQPLLLALLSQVFQIVVALLLDFDYTVVILVLQCYPRNMHSASLPQPLLFSCHYTVVTL
jgi:hypothetical protein